MEAARSIPGSQTDAEGNMQVDLVNGVEQYEDTVLFISGECNVFIGPDYQKNHLQYFPRHKMVVIEDAGHNMFLDQPEAFFSVVRSYLRN
jgi:pimeloyl-ACP methyl ester carboxylesterase